MSQIINFYDKLPKSLLPKSTNPNYSKIGIKLPFRMCIVGSSGSGKTNTLLNLIYLMPNTFADICLLTKNSDEPLYNLLKEKLGDHFNIFENYDDLPTIDEYDKTKQHLVVFDDIVLDKKQDKMIEYFIRASKQNVSVIYISQSYFGIPKEIRGNINYLIVKKIAQDRDLNLIFSEYSLGVDKKTLVNMYRQVSENPMNFLLIDVDEPNINRKFRLNFDSAFIIES